MAAERRGIKGSDDDRIRLGIVRLECKPSGGGRRGADGVAAVVVLAVTPAFAWALKEVANGRGEWVQGVESLRHLSGTAECVRVSELIRVAVDEGRGVAGQVKGGSKG